MDVWLRDNYEHWYKVYLKEHTDTSYTMRITNDEITSDKLNEFCEKFGFRVQRMAPRLSDGSFGREQEPIMEIDLERI